MIETVYLIVCHQTKLDLQHIGLQDASQPSSAPDERFKRRRFAVVTEASDRLGLADTLACGSQDMNRSDKSPKAPAAAERCILCPSQRGACASL